VTARSLADGIAAAVVGVADVAAATSWLAHLGFTEVADLRLTEQAAARLYPGAPSLGVRELRQPGASRGAVRLVAAAQTPAPPPHPYARGPYAFLVYTRDIERTLEIAAQDGARPSPVAAYRAGAKHMREARAVYPDGLVVVFVDVAERRPSLLDTHPDRLHSEVHSVTFVVDDVDAAAAAAGAAGMATIVDLEIAEPSVTAFLELPRPDTRLRLAMLATPDQSPARIEVMTYPDDAGPAAPAAGGPVAIGLRAAMARVADVNVVDSRGAVTPVIETGVPGASKCRLVDLAGIHVELWEDGP
jgi:hypothetical protein